MASLRRIVTLSTLVPVTGGAVAALLACAPPPAAPHPHAPAAVSHAAPVQAAQPASALRATGKDTGRTLNRLVTLTAEKIALGDACQPGTGGPTHPHQRPLTDTFGKPARVTADHHRTNREAASPKTVTADDAAKTKSVTAQDAGRHAERKAYKHLRSLCTTSKDRLNTIDARLVTVVKQARPLLATPQGKQELKQIEARTAKAFHFDAAQTASLAKAVARETGTGAVKHAPTAERGADHATPAPHRAVKPATAKSGAERTTDRDTAALAG